MVASSINPEPTMTTKLTRRSHAARVIESPTTATWMTDAGYAAIGQKRPMLPDDVQPMDTTDDLQLWRASRSAPAPSSRAGDGTAPPAGRPACN